jgi:hypothetical protein
MDRERAAWGMGVRQVMGWLEALGDRIFGGWPRSHLAAGESEAVPLAEEPATVFRGIVYITITVVALQCLLHLLDAAVFDLQIERLDADSDKSVWSWTGSAAELMAALGAGLLMAVAPTRWKWLAFLTVVFTFFSMDDEVRIHEGLGNLAIFHTAGISARFVWPVLYAPLMLLTYILTWRVSGAMADRCRRAVRGGLVMLGVAIVLEFAASTLIIKAGYGRIADDTRVGSMLYEYEVIVEEALELAGWLLIAAAFIATGLDLLYRRARTRAHALEDAPRPVRDPKQRQPADDR